MNQRQILESTLDRVQRETIEAWMSYEATPPGDAEQAAHRVEDMERTCRALRSILASVAVWGTDAVLLLDARSGTKAPAHLIAIAPALRAELLAADTATSVSGA